MVHAGVARVAAWASFEDGYSVDKAVTSIWIGGPFSLKATALGHGWHECSPMSWCEGGGCLQVIERRGGMPVRLSLTSGGRRGHRVGVKVTVEAMEMSDELLSLMRSRVRTMLRADADLSGFFELAESDEGLAPLVRVGAGRILRSASMTENIVKVICATNVNWAQAVKMINRIGQLGPHLKEFRSQNSWPTPAEILSAGEGYLLNVARVGYRAKSIMSFCRSVLEGTFDAEDLDVRALTASTQELYKRLLSIRGIGPSSANFLLGQLGRHEQMSIDSWTKTYVSRKHFGGRKATVRQIENVYARYGRWRNLVWWFEQWMEWDTARSMLAEGGELN